MEAGQIQNFLQQSGLGAEMALLSGVLGIVLVYFFLPRQAFGLSIWISLFALSASFYFSEYCPAEGDFLSLRFASYTPMLKRFFLVSGSVGLFAYLEWRSGRNLPQRPEIFILLLISLLGLMFMVTAGSFWLLFISAEVFSLCAYGLAQPEMEEENAAFSMVRYFGIGAFASALAIFGLSWLLGFEFNGLETKAFEDPVFVMIRTAGYVLFIAFLLFKSGNFPFHFWVPSVYEKGPTPWIGFISVAPKLASAFALLWVSKMVDIQVSIPLFIFCIAGMILGNLAAYQSKNLKNLFAFSSISQAAFLMVPSIFSQEMPNTENQLLVYSIAFGVVNQGAFCAIQFFENHLQDNLKINDLAGHFSVQPLPSLLFFILIISLIGLPPTIGFSGKLLLFSTLLPLGGNWAGNLSFLLFAALVLSTVLSLGYFYKIPFHLIFKPKTMEDIPLRNSAYSFFWLIFVSLFSLIAFFSPGIFFPLFN
jgi:NADH-quinone oxidoreductase subunit N